MAVANNAVITSSQMSSCDAFSLKGQLRARLRPLVQMRPSPHPTKLQKLRSRRVPFDSFPAREAVVICSLALLEHKQRAWRDPCQSY